MENASENRDLSDAQAVVSSDDIAPESPRTRRERVRQACHVDDERRPDLHASFNHRISYLCKMAALVIAVVTFGSVVLGQDDLRFVILGLCLSVALLAIALLQDSSQHRR
ncbi:MAG: propionyl-CoA carboxylase subunit beta [Gordonibacter sp.]|uniref:propionyl-CoA carboxylase subunit beta n=1 Tax=Gordonibacter sp. TaxID=1968902 RepID=UPI002FCB3905